MQNWFFFATRGSTGRCVIRTEIALLCPVPETNIRSSALGIPLSGSPVLVSRTGAEHKVFPFHKHAFDTLHNGREISPS